ncbi:short chain dehydrogenase/ reductase-like protein [Macrophomina phaseolina]|uniref:Short chain dehydrogenase/ reductase-like protein n=1 Tax=Macrophomina phaseolina TaxID=35725 RepID=A0ABQ8FTU4_9PEZI|nr:short chain dehydrogenase/ reductase-like protein [Macrophomina phaseolina]
MTSRSEFGQDTKASEVADVFASQIKGRVVAITGIAKDGLGGATASAIAKHGPALLILISRTQSKIDEVIAEIKAINPHANVKSVLVDLLSQASVRSAADEVKNLTTRIDLLINNAGFTIFKRKWSPEGIEAHLAGNHLGPFLLTNLLMDRLLAAAEASPRGTTRVINLSSMTHVISPFRFHDYNIESKPVPPEEDLQADGWPKEIVQATQDGYMGFPAYAQSKTANILFTIELNRRFSDKGLVSYSVHPGVVGSTGFNRDMDPALLEASAEMMKYIHIKPSNDEGASTTMVAALDPALNGSWASILTSYTEPKGIYLSDCQFADPAPHASNAEYAKKVWALSEELVKQTF